VSGPNNLEQGLLSKNLLFYAVESSMTIPQRCCFKAHFFSIYLP
jgi:hypothetical protein